MKGNVAWLGPIVAALTLACGSTSRRSSPDTTALPADVSREGEPQRPLNGTPTRDPEAPSLDEGGGEVLPLEPCAGRTIAAGEIDRVVLSGGRERRFHISIPPNQGDAPLPLLLSFHGLTETGEGNRTWTRFDALGRTKKFVSVFLDGVDRSWNAGSCCDPAVSSQVDDVRFVAETIANLSAELCIDERRVYASGFSNGGFLSYRLACELGDRIAAIAVVSGAMPAIECKPKRAVPIVHVHGTYDPVVPMPGSPLGFPSTQDTIAGWVARNACSEKPRESFRAGNGKCSTWGGCANGAEVTLCTLEGTVHTWQNGTWDPSAPTPTSTFVTTPVLWDYLARYKL